MALLPLKFLVPPSGLVRPPASEPVCGDSAATTLPSFDELYAESVQFVWRSLARLGVRDDQLADATQDVFVVVHRRLADFEGRSSLKTWIFGIALRVASTARRSGRRHSETLSEDLVDERVQAPFEAAVRTEAVDLLYRALGELTHDQRAVFILVELEQMSVPEAARAVSANIHTATSRLKTARRRFDEAVQRRRGQGESP